MSKALLDGIKGFLFDVDGTLIDSNHAHALAWSDAFREGGFEVPLAKIEKAIGMGGDHLLPALADLDKEKDPGKSIDKRRGEIFREKYLPQLRAFDGARALLEHLRDRGFTLVIATSASTQDLKALLKQAGLEGIVDDKTTSSDAESSKPDPDIIQAAMKKAGLPADALFMVGDTPYDIEAASRAGVRTIAFTSGGWSRQDLSQAAAVFDGAADYLKFIQ